MFEKMKELKKKENILLLSRAVLFALLPLVMCLVYCASKGQSIGKVYLPGCEWNDELFYYKQVESIIKFGYPQGYYGFNESHALKLSFAAWSPVLVFPWILWGLLFGWNLMSPILCNIVLLTLAFFAFFLLVKPTWKQQGILSLLVCLFYPFVRYLLSAMPEIICFSLLIVFYGIAIRYLENHSKAGLVWLFGLASLMTLMRPYLLLMLLLPAALWIGKDRKKGIIGSALVIGVTLVLYALIKHFLGAEYFAPLFFTDWVTAFFERGLFGGTKYFLYKLYVMGSEFRRYVVQSFLNGFAPGAFFSCFLCVLLLTLVQSIADFKPFCKKDKKAKLFPVEAHLAISTIGMLFALLLMYKLNEGSKHLLTFVAAGIFVVGMMPTKFFKKAVLLGACFAYLFSFRESSPMEYLVPFATRELVAQVESVQETLSEKLELVTTDVPNYDNTVIWVFSSATADQSAIVTKWQLLYEMPAGYGISCCYDTYILENFDTLQSRYLCVAAGTLVDERCTEAGYEELYRDEEFVFFARY